MSRIAIVLGTRPEIIKLAHIVRMLGDEAVLIHTGQHYDWNLSQVFFPELRLPEPHVHLEVGGQSRGAQVGTATTLIDDYFASDRPDAVVVQGDTNTTLAAALAANARDVPIVHVEAGLRSFDRAMPEEHNRVLTDHLADLHCAPTTISRDNLLAERLGPDSIVVTGNTVIEAVAGLLPDEASQTQLLSDYGLSPAGYVLATFHRPENVDDTERLETILDELAKLPLPVLFPMHPRTRAQVEAFGLERRLDGVQVVEPVGYRTFLALAAQSAFLVSDSGGVQEEVSVLKRPVIVVRRSTERPEVLGTFAELVEAGPAIGEIGRRWASDVTSTHRRLAGVPSPYGDGTASRRTVEALRAMLESR